MKTQRDYLLFAAISIACLLVFPGCTHIPAGAAEEYTRTTNVMGVTSQTSLTGIKVTGRTIKAESGTFTLAFPGFTHTQTVKGLTLPNPAPDKPAPAAPSP